MVRPKTDDELRSIISGYIRYGINEVIVDLEISQRPFSKFPLSEVNQMFGLFFLICWNLNLNGLYLFEAIGSTKAKVNSGKYRRALDLLHQSRKMSERCDTDDADDSIFGTFDRYNDIYTDENDSTDDNSKDGSEDDAEDSTKQDSPNIHDSHGIVTETEKIGILLEEIPAHHKRSEASRELNLHCDSENIK
ncbi:hypothetical protein BGZ46_002911 [Entomortierella lignicola]|nr:hypothetical protein BGZ46_002911 [Entomortierella lignicola]